MRVQAEVYSCFVANQLVATSCPAATEAVPIPTVEPAALLWRRGRPCHLGLRDGSRGRAPPRYDEHVTSGPTQTGLSPEQAAREATLRELGEAMVAIEAAAGRVRRAASMLARRLDADPTIVAALERSARELDASRRRLHHDGYLADPQGALFPSESEPETGPLVLFPVEAASE